MFSFPKGSFVAVDYPEFEGAYAESGVFIGCVREVKEQERRMKVMFIYHDGSTDDAWLENTVRHKWKDKSFAAMVTISPATEEQKNDVLRCLSSQRRQRLLGEIGE